MTTMPACDILDCPYRSWCRHADRHERSRACDCKCAGKDRCEKDDGDGSEGLMTLCRFCANANELAYTVGKVQCQVDGHIVDKDHGCEAWKAKENKDDKEVL